MQTRNLVFFIALAWLLQGCQPHDDAANQDEVAAAPLTPITDAEGAVAALHAVTDSNRVDTALSALDVGAMLTEVAALSGRPGHHRPLAATGPANPPAAQTLQRGFSVPLAQARIDAGKAPAADSGAGVSDETRDCDGAGSLRLEQSSGADGTVVTATFSHCRRNNTDGSYRVSDGRLQTREVTDTTHWSLRIEVGSGDYPIDRGADSSDLHTLNYDQAGNLLRETWVSATLASASDDAADGSAGVYTFSGNGSSRQRDLLNGHQDNAYMRDVLVITRYTAADSNGTDLQADGVLQTESDYDQDGKADVASYLGLQDYHLLLATTDGNTDNYTLQTDGKMVVSHLPAGCDDGVFDTTTLTPIRSVAGSWTAGRLRINKDTDVLVIRDGLLQITAGGQRSEMATTRLNELCS